MSVSAVADNKTEELIVPFHIFKGGMLQTRQLPFSEQSCWVSQHSFIVTSLLTRFGATGVLLMANSNSQKGRLVLMILLHTPSEHVSHIATRCTLQLAAHLVPGHEIHDMG